MAINTTKTKKKKKTPEKKSLQMNYLQNRIRLADKENKLTDTKVRRSGSLGLTDTPYYVN